MLAFCIGVTPVILDAIKKSPKAVLPKISLLFNFNPG
jgi:hypothetical protein